MARSIPSQKMIVVEQKSKNQAINIKDASVGQGYSSNKDFPFFLPLTHSFKNMFKYLLYDRH